MKTPLLYGLYIGLASALFNLVLFLLGYHSDPAKLNSVQWPSMLIGIGIGVTGIILGIQARRAEYPAHEPFGYARALGAGILVGVFAALFSAALQVIYVSLINPEFKEVVVQGQAAVMEEKGQTSDAVEAAAKVTRMMFHPAIQFFLFVVMGVFWNTLVSLIAAALLRRPAGPPPATPAPI